MNRFDQNWQKLVALARQAPATDDVTLPPGFATRVVALGTARASTSPWGGLERLAFRGFVASMACCAAAVVYSYLDRAGDLNEGVDVDDTVTELLDLS